MISQVVMTTAVKELMNTNVVHLHPMDLMTKAKAIFDNNEFHHIPICDDNEKVVGMISRMDYNRILSCHMLFNQERNEKHNAQNLQSLLTRDVMKKNIVAIRETDALTKAAEIFRENHFHGLPVVNEEKKLLGIITTYDLLIFAYS